MWNYSNVSQSLTKVKKISISKCCSHSYISIINSGVAGEAILHMKLSRKLQILSQKINCFFAQLRKIFWHGLFCPNFWVSEVVDFLKMSLVFLLKIYYFGFLSSFSKWRENLFLLMKVCLNLQISIILRKISAANHKLIFYLSKVLDQIFAKFFKYLNFLIKFYEVHHRPQWPTRGLPLKP